MDNNLENLIKYIKLKHAELSCKWKNNKEYLKINLKNIEVRDIINHSEILDTVFKYREFLNENNIQLSIDFEKFNIYNNKVNTRVKQKNSVEYKFKNYMTEKHNFRKRAYK